MKIEKNEFVKWKRKWKFQIRQPTLRKNMTGKEMKTNNEKRWKNEELCFEWGGLRKEKWWCEKKMLYRCAASAVNFFSLLVSFVLFLFRDEEVPSFDFWVRFSFESFVCEGSGMKNLLRSLLLRGMLRAFKMWNTFQTKVSFSCESETETFCFCFTLSNLSSINFLQRSQNKVTWADSAVDSRTWQSDTKRKRIL